MILLIAIHAGLIVWASTFAISYLYRVDLSSESVKVRSHVNNSFWESAENKTKCQQPLSQMFNIQVNEALEVFGERESDPTAWMDGENEDNTRQAHVRIGSRTSL